MIAHICHVRATFPCQDAIYKGDMLLFGQTFIFRIEMTCENGTDLPAWTADLVSETCHSVAEKETHVLFECVGCDDGAVPTDLHLGTDCGTKLKNASVKYGKHIVR